MNFRGRLFTHGVVVQMAIQRINQFLSTMADAFAEVEQHDVRVTAIYMHPADLKAGLDSLEGTDLILREGEGDTLWGARFVPTEGLVRGHGMLACDTNAGEYTIRTDVVRSLCFTLKEGPAYFEVEADEVPGQLTTPLDDEELLWLFRQESDPTTKS